MAGVGRSDACLKCSPFFFVDHCDEIGEAFIEAHDVRRLAPVFAGGAVAFDVIERRAKSTQEGSIDTDFVVVHDQTGDFFTPRFSLNSGLRFVQLAAFLLDNEFDLSQSLSDFVLSFSRS